MSTSSIRLSQLLQFLRGTLPAFLAAVLILHAFVAPFADADLVLCVGNDGHVAFELVQLSHHHVAPHPKGSTQSDASTPSSDQTCRDLALAGLNRFGLYPTPKVHWTLVNPEPANLDAAPLRSLIVPSVQRIPSISTFPTFLLSTVLLI